MSGGSVDDSTALIECDVVGKNAGNLYRQKWMLELHALKFASFERCADTNIFNSGIRLQCGNAIGREKQRALIGINDGVLVIGMEGQRAVMRNGPRRGCPDNRANFGTQLRSSAPGHDRKLHPD